MFYQTDIRELQPGLTPFPTEVFASGQAWLAAHLLPLISVDLGILRPELAGNVATMLCPVEPYEGCLGEETEADHNACIGTNWIAFELMTDSRMRFLGEEGYFLGSNAQDPELVEHIGEMRDSYERAKAYFKAHGRLASYSHFGEGGPNEQAYLDTLGGQISDGNWTETAPIPPAFELWLDPLMYERDQAADAENVRITRAGRPFFAVATVAGYNWCATGPDAIVMLYEPDSRTVLFSFDWT